MTNWLQKNPLIHLFVTTWSLSKGRRGVMALYLFMSTAAMAVTLCFPVLIARLMNTFQTAQGDELLDNVLFYLGLMIVSDLVFWSLHGPSRLIETQLGFHAKSRYQDGLFGMVTRLPTRWHRDHHSGETIDQVARATTAIGDFAGRTFEVVHMLCRFFGALVILSLFLPWAGLAVSLVSIGVITAVFLYDRVLIAQYKQLNKSYNEIAAAVQDYLTNVATIISLRLEDRVGREITERMYKVFPLVRRNSRLNELKWFTASIMVTTTQALVLIGYCVIAIRSGDPILAGTFFALYEYLRSIGEAFFNFTWKYGDLIMQSAKVRGVEHINAAYTREVKDSQSARLPDGWTRIAVTGLSFSHAAAGEKSSPAHIQGVHFGLERGKSYAFVGESGSGKSTVLGLIRGIHTPDRCSVTCDGAALPFGLTHVAHHTTLIPQDPEIFSETVRFNITMGIEANPQRIDEAVKQARFSAVLERLPKGLDTNIAEKGVSLSGGEKQRLALARGLFFVEESNSEILLLDEPTSSVDLFNERRIYEEVLNRNKGRCVVSSIHKFHLLHLFDEVVVFANGRVAESGSVSQLLAQKGEFARLWSNFMDSEIAA